MTPWLSSQGSDAMKDTAGVIARPPILFLTAILLGLLFDRLLPLASGLLPAGPVRWVVAGLFLVAGLVLATAGIRNFSRAGTPVPTSEPTRALATSGIHAWTRNPIYVGLFLLYG